MGKTVLVAPSWIYRKFKAIRDLLSKEPKAALLSDTLQIAVPFRQLDLVKKGGPSELDFEFCRQFAWDLGSYGDALIYRTPKSQHSPGTAEMFNRLARAIAIMSFVPGGVELFGVRYELSRDMDGYDQLETRLQTKRKNRPKIKRKKRHAHH